MPSLVFVELLSIFFVLVAGRHILFKVCKRPEEFTSLLNRSVNKLCQLCVPIFWMGLIVLNLMMSNNTEYLRQMLNLWDNLYFKI